MKRKEIKTEQMKKKNWFVYTAMPFIRALMYVCMHLCTYACIYSYKRTG